MLTTAVKGVNEAHSPEFLIARGVLVDTDDMDAPALKFLGLESMSEGLSCSVFIKDIYLQDLEAFQRRNRNRDRVWV